MADRVERWIFEAEDSELAASLRSLLDQTRALGREAEKTADTQEKAAERAAKAQTQALNRLRGIEEQATIDSLNGIERIQAARDAEIRKIHKLAQEAGNSAEIQEAALTAVAAANAKAAARIERFEERLAKGGKGAQSQLEGLKFAAQGAGGQAGEFAGRVENAGRALSIFAANPATAALAAITAIGLGAVVAGGLTVAAMVEIVKAADDARKALEPFRKEGLGLDEADTDAVKAAAAALDAVHLIGQQLISELGAELAPTVQEVATYLVAMGLTAVDVFNGMAEGTGLVQDVLVRAIEFGINPMTASFLTLAETVAFVARQMGKPLPKLEEWAELQRENQTAAGLLDLAVDGLNLTLGDNVDRAREIVDAVGRERDAREADTKAIEAQKRALEELDALAEKSTERNLKGFELIAYQRNQEIAHLREVATAAGDADLQTIESRIALAEIEKFYDDQTTELQLANIDEVRKKFDAWRKEQAKSADMAAREAEQEAEQEAKQRIASANAIGQSIMGLTGTLAGHFDSVVKGYEEGGDVTEKAARQAFAASKAIGIADVAIKTGMGIMNAFATLPTIAAIPAAAAIGVTGGIQAAIIASQEFGGGGGGASAQAPNLGGVGAGGTATGPTPLEQAGFSVTKGPDEVVGPHSMARPDQRSGTFYRQRDLDVVSRDGRSTPGSPFHQPVGTGQRRSG